jgi:hypothetical protein
MPHLHFCDHSGHYWQCEETALRPDAGDTEPSTCMCLMHGVPIEEGDHSGCPVELLACPEHRQGTLTEPQTVSKLQLPAIVKRNLKAL